MLGRMILLRFDARFNGMQRTRINLFAGVKLPVAALEVDGDKQKMAYGSSSSAA